MFLSYQYIKHIEYHKEAGEHSFQYEIIDSELGTISGIAQSSTISCELSSAVIDAYEKRNLNVAANLIKAFIWKTKKSSQFMADLITWNKKYNPKFAKYEKDIEKYMVLL